MVSYHSGGSAAAFEPFNRNLTDWDNALSQCLGAGCGMTWRGTRLYTTKGDASYNLIKSKVEWFKRHRAILTSDIIHVKQPTGQGIDAFLHVNPRLESEKALAMVFNPTDRNITETLVLPLYLSGLVDSVLVSIDGATPPGGSATAGSRLLVGCQGDCTSAVHELDSDHRLSSRTSMADVGPVSSIQ